MAEAFPEEGNVIILPDSFAKFLGRTGTSIWTRSWTSSLCMRQATSTSGQCTLRALTFSCRIYATMLATAYALAERPELLSDTLRSRTVTKQRYASFEDMDLIYDGIGFDNYDWLQVETVRLAVFFVKGRDLAALVKDAQAAFPPGEAMSNDQAFRKLETIRPALQHWQGRSPNQPR